MATFMTVTGLAGALAALAAVYFAWQTARLAAAQRRSGEHDRRLRDLREIAGLVERIFWDAKSASFARRYEGDGSYRCPEQDSLAQVLAGLDSPLLECSRLVEAETSFRASEVAISARREVRQAIEAEHRAARTPPPGLRATLAPLLARRPALPGGLSGRLPAGLGGRLRASADSRLRGAAGSGRSRPQHAAPPAGDSSAVGQASSRRGTL